jgi:hypothetical protein
VRVFRSSALALSVMLSITGTLAAAASTPSQPDDPQITTVNLPIVSAWWSNHGKGVAKVRSDALKLQGFYLEKHAPSHSEFSTCRLLTHDTGTPEIALEQAIHSSTTNAARRYWTSLFDTISALDGAGNQCALHSTSRNVHATSKSRSDLKTGIRRINEVFNALHSAGIAVAGSPVATTIPPTTVPPTTVPPTTVPPTTVPAPVTTTTESQARAIINWFQSNVGTFQTLQNDLDNINAAGNGGDPSGVLSGCQQLTSDTTAAQRIPPIPDQEFQGDWAASLADFASGAQDCINGIQNGDVLLMSRYKTEINAGISEQKKVTDAIGG